MSAPKMACPSPASVEGKTPIRPSTEERFVIVGMSTHEIC